MSVEDNQRRTFLRLITQLRPHWASDAALPARIQMLLARHRQFGSRDRKLYRELIYTAVRYRPWIEPLLDREPGEALRRVAWFAADLPATHTFKETFAVGPPPGGDKTELLPAWFKAHCPEIFAGAELDAQLRRAPVWLRLQTEASALVFEEFDRRGWKWLTPSVPGRAIQLLTEADVISTDAWRQGLVEVQDVGSQLILETIGIEPRGHWLDACAGAGGKTLQLAGVLGAAGRIDAHDVRPATLDELQIRATRAHHWCRVIAGADATNGPGAAADRTRPQIRIVRGAIQGVYDGVLVDAPCSGSGTWRRAPHLKWVTTEESIVRAGETQRTLLDRFSAHVRPGGRLVYATCSLSARENETVVNAFLAAHPEYRPETFTQTFGATLRSPGLLILPAHHDSDGFFVASLRRN